MVQPIASRPQTCTVCYCTEFCRQLILYYIILYYIILYYIILYYIILYYIILYYNNLTGPLLFMRSVVDRNVVMRRMTVQSSRETLQI